MLDPHKPSFERCQLFSPGQPVIANRSLSDREEDHIGRSAEVLLSQTLISAIGNTAFDQLKRALCGIYRSGRGCVKEKLQKVVDF